MSQIKWLHWQGQTFATEIEGNNKGYHTLKRVRITEEPPPAPPATPSITVTIKPNGDIEIDGAGPDVRIVDERKR